MAADSFPPITGFVNQKIDNWLYVVNGQIFPRIRSKIVLFLWNLFYGKPMFRAKDFHHDEISFASS